MIDKPRLVGRQSVEEEEIKDQILPLPPPFSLTEHGLSAPFGPRPTIEQCGEAAQRLKRILGSVKYWFGDLINLTEALHGEEASQVIDAELVDEQTASELRFVTKNVAVPVRRMSPGWDYSKVVANLKPEKQQQWLQQALDGEWIASKLKSEIAAAGAGGQTALRFLLIVDAKTEAKQKELAKKLEADGFVVTLRSSVKKEPKAKKAKGGKKAGPVTARKRRGAAKPYTRRRTPTGPPRS